MYVCVAFTLSCLYMRVSVRVCVRVCVYVRLYVCVCVCVCVCMALNVTCLYVSCHIWECAHARHVTLVNVIKSDF